MKGIDRLVLLLAALCVLGAIVIAVTGGAAVTPLWAWIEHNDKQLVVLFTFGIFVFTLLLAHFTKKLWGSTRDLVRETLLGNAPFLVPIALIAERFLGQGSEHTDARRARIVYAFHNQGKTPAIIRRFRDFSVFTRDLPDHPAFTEAWANRPEEYIPVGVDQTGGHLVVRVPAGMSGVEAINRVGVDRHWLYIIGEVEYADPANFIRVQRYCIAVHDFLREQPEGMPERLRPVFMRAGGRTYNELREGAASD